MGEFVKGILDFNSWLNGIVWGTPMLILLVGTGLFLTFRTNFVAFSKLSYVFKSTLCKLFKKNDKSSGSGEVSAFAAVSTALAATVGTGNIAGVATAIASGGPGAVFWMWVAALVGMTTKYSEVVLSIKYRKKTEDGRYLGGPMYYIKQGLNNSIFAKILAGLFAIFGALAAFGIGDMVQANSISSALKTTFNTDNLIVGIVVAVLALIVLIGGIKRIGKITTYLVPIMALFYIGGALFIILANIGNIPKALGLVFSSAFNGQAAIGGFLGAGMKEAIKFGVARGIFTNEAGLGSSPIAHAASTTDHPVRQGLWGIFEVFVDTLVICTMTALVILTTNSWESGLSGAELTINAFSTGLPGNWGGIIVSVGLVLFAFSSILGWAYYGEKCAEYLVGPWIILPYKVAFAAFSIVGAVGSLQVLWKVADTLNGLMAIPNLIGLALLSGIVARQTNEFFSNSELVNKVNE